MLSKFKSAIVTNIKNARGWRTNRKIVLIESDDWGSIRMPSKKVFNKLLESGIRVDNCHYCKYDSLESEDDLSLLFNILNSVKDINFKPAVLTANSVVTNPDFGKIRQGGFSEYFYVKTTESYGKFKGCENSLKLLKEAQFAGNLSIQSHGREHLNIQRWMQYLKNDYRETMFAFNLGVYGISTTITSENRKSFLPAFDFETEEQEEYGNYIVKDGLRIFKEIYGFSSKSFIAPNYTWSKSLEKALYEGGVKYIQGAQIHKYKVKPEEKTNKRLRYNGKQNNYGQIDLARNCMFEPSENPNKDWVNSCLSQINRAFYWKHPAIISSHRVNFMGGMDVKNRDKNLRHLKKLLFEIKKRWPDVEFMSSNDLGDLITNMRDDDQ
jgi:hypothetical protein